MPRLFAVDSMAVLYRGYFAMIRTPLINSKGLNTSGIRTFDPPGATPAQATYVRCRMVADSVERGELSKTFWDAQ